MRKALFTFIFVSFASIALKAQYDAQFSNYWAALNYFNPAVAGQTSNLEATAMYRQQWLGFEGAPQSFFVAADMPFKFFGKTHGIGLVFFNESLGLFKHNIISGQYAYKKKLFGGLLGVGLQASMISETFDGAGVYIPVSPYHQQTDDGIPMSEVTGSAIDFALGLYYSRKQWYAGLSATHLTEPKMEMGENAVFYPVRTYYLMGGYNIQLNNPLLELQPSIFVKSIVQATLFDINARLCYNKMLWGGLGWRYGDAAMVTLGAKFGKIQVGYAYDFPITDIRKGTTGSHELFLKYTMELTPGKGNKNKHKSVRIL